MANPKNLLLLEMNEITQTILTPLMAKGRLPNFARFFSEGTVAHPHSVDLPPHLDPWIAWVTLHTGVTRDVHGAQVLGQDTVNAKRTWDYVVDAGRTVGIFGSISAYPPRPVPGFMIPGPFSPTDDAYPAYASPAVHLNRRYTQVHAKNQSKPGLLEMAKLGWDVLGLGVKPTTLARVAEQLTMERIDRYLHWRRVCMQPLVNYDVFETLYKRYRPSYATWHTGHCAHLEHHYWRAWDDSKFLVRATEEEKQHYGHAIPYAYELADELLGRFFKLAGDDTIVGVASGLGMQPYVKEEFPEGRHVVRFKDLRRVLALLGAEGVTEVVPAMVPQWNVRVPDGEKRATLKARIEKARMVNGAKPNAFHVAETGELLTVTPSGLAKLVPGIRYFFDGAPGADPNGYAIEELCAIDTPTPKEGYHHPEGVFFLRGPGIPRGLEIPTSNNLDVAPTLLSLMGLPVPSAMKGNVLVGERVAPKSTQTPAVSASAS